MQDICDLFDEINIHLGEDFNKTVMVNTFKNSTESFVEKVTKGQKPIDALFFGTIEDGIVSLFKSFIKLKKVNYVFY